MDRLVEVLAVVLEGGLKYFGPDKNGKWSKYDPKLSCSAFFAPRSPLTSLN